MQDNTPVRRRRWRTWAAIAGVVAIVGAAVVQSSSGDPRREAPDQGETVQFTPVLELCVSDDAGAAAPVSAGARVDVPSLSIGVERRGPTEAWGDPADLPAASAAGRLVPYELLTPCDPADTVQCLNAPAIAVAEGGGLVAVDPAKPVTLAGLWAGTLDGRRLWVSLVDSIAWEPVTAIVPPHSAPYPCGPLRRTTPPELTRAVPEGIPVDKRDRVAGVIEAANDIAGFPYRYGVAHAQDLYRSEMPAEGYDGSAAVSHALHGGGFVESPQIWQELIEFGKPGPGEWITVYVCGSRSRLVVAGMHFDVWGEDGGPSGPRWRDRSAVRGCEARHPAGY